jgi:hypothetical protein
MSVDLSWLPDGIAEGHMPNSVEVCEIWRQIKATTNFKTVTEIGFNSGHSSSIVMSLFDDVTVTSYDICLHPETLTNSAVVKKHFGDRFNFHPYHSYFLREDYLAGVTPVEKTDIILIDGSHRGFFVNSDAELAEAVGFEWILFDDYDFGSVRDQTHRDTMSFQNSWRYETRNNNGTSGVSQLGLFKKTLA